MGLVADKERLCDEFLAGWHSVEDPYDANPHGLECGGVPWCVVLSVVWC